MSFQKWLDGPYDLHTKKEIRTLLKHDPDALNDAFYRNLSFGTGGMRGLMGVGTNRINIYTIRMATQGLANYLLKLCQARLGCMNFGSARQNKIDSNERDHRTPCKASEENRFGEAAAIRNSHNLSGPGIYGKRAFIGYDVRNNSRLFAEETARTLAGNGIEALITEEVCPTPLASFACRTYGCDAAIMITASHNPPEYNGYKVYGPDGAQIVPPVDEMIIREVRNIQSLEQVKLADLKDPLIHWIGKEIDDAYLKELETLKKNHDPKTLSIIYTNLHGTGARLVPRALMNWGFSSPRLVDAQVPLDGAFPAARTPNPEEEKALVLGTKLLLEERADILLATDPDADRIGLVVRKEDQSIRFNGNEIACICLAHLVQKGNVLKESAILKTIVTTELLRKIAQSASLRSFDVLTGFKYIAEKIREWEKNGQKHQFLFGAEESHGILTGTFVRDKDAIVASCLIAEAADWQKTRGRTLVDALYDLYRSFGVHRQSLATLVFVDNSIGLELMQNLMKKLRKSPPSSVGDKKVTHFKDLLQRGSLPKADVLLFVLEDSTRLVIRPSGTEPKIKIYLEVSNPVQEDLQASIASCDARLKQTLDSFRKENNLPLATC